MNVSPLQPTTASSRTQHLIRILPLLTTLMDTLVAVALYTDGRPNAVADAKDFAMMVTAQPVLADTRNKAPVFADQDEEMEGEQTDQERSVFENVPMIGNAVATMAVRPVGAVVTAMDSIINPSTGEAQHRKY